MNRNLIYYIITACISILIATSCDNGKKGIEPKAAKADSLIFQIGTTKNYNYMRHLVDSLEPEGSLTALDANRWRGVSYYRQGQYSMSELCYRRAINCEVKNDQDQLSYNKCARRLSELLLIKGDYEGSLKVAIPAIEKMEKTGIGSDIDYAILLNNIGCCQLNLGCEDEANESFLTAREHYANRWTSDSTGRGVQEAVIGTIYTSMAYINTRRYAESIYWIDRTEMLLNEYKKKPDARSEDFDEYQGRIDIMRAVAMQGLNKSDDAKTAYQAFLKTNYSKTAAGHINATDYLVVAQRFKEAADNYRYLDQTLSDIGTELSLDNIQLYLLPKYRANYEAGRGDSARYMGQYILSLLDSAITLQKNSAIAELATIYDTNQKDAQIAQQQTLMARQRWISTLVALVLLTTFFIIYTLHRRRAQRHLAAAYKKLEEGNAKLSILNSQLTVANAKAEESSKMKTNFIQQISHEIRTPLNILSGFTQVITTPGMELDEETRSDINRQITENTDRITGLVNKMLELSDVSSQTVIERNDNAFGIQLAAQAADASGINDAGHLTFDMDIAPDSENTELKTNEQQATRALALLLDNAIKFTKKGKVTLRINTDQQRNTLNYVVEDTGIGIPANEAEHIFEEFVQLDDYYDGTGIGLTVARSITRRLGGDIILDTTYTSGARFVMSLPL